jgi:type I restriction enzyme M protein
VYDAAFKNIDDTLWKDAGCSSELDYIEQTSWILFLKYLDDYEKENSDSALLNGEVYNSILSDEFSWSTWASPKSNDGKLDYNAALTGDDLREFVNYKLFPYLKQFKITAENANTLEYKIGEIFSEINNKIQSGYSLREVINKVDELSFLSNDDKHELSSLYEDKIKNMGNAGRNGGQYYTPRPLIRAMINIIDPQIGEKIYDELQIASLFAREIGT